MGRCKNCGVEMGPDETCVFATYKTNVGGREIIVCCPSCASDLEQAATQPAEPAPPAKVPVRKAARKVKKAVKAKKPARKVKKAVKAKKPARKVKKAVKAKKPARKVKKAVKAKKPARRPARRARK